jgi:2-iminoacetate synthase
MFSSEHDRLWQALPGETVVPQPASLSILESATPFDPRLPDLLFTDRSGDAKAFDAQVLDLARRLKGRHFDGRVFAVVPVYVTSICGENCSYCNFRSGNHGLGVERLRLTDEELEREVRHLIAEKGMRTIELVYASDPRMRPDAICRHIEMVKRLVDRSGGGIVGLSAEAFDVADYRRMVDAGLTFSVLWQETYDRARYTELHATATRKAGFEYRLDAYERMIAGGIGEIGMGVLSGLADWRRDWSMLMRHQEYLWRQHGVLTGIIGTPRLKPAPGALLHHTPFIPAREEYLFALAVQQIFSPLALPFVSTREEWDVCVEMARGGGCLFTFNCSTIPGGYSLGHRGAQFQTRSYDSTVYPGKLRGEGMHTEFSWTFETARSRHVGARLEHAAALE